MAQRHYSSTAAAMQLQGSVNGSSETLTVDKVVGLPVSYPFTVVIDPGTESEEIVTVTNVAGTTLTVVRGEDGTSGVPHSGGAVIRHMVTARDLREPQQHIAATTDVHGVTGSLPGRLEALETLMGDAQIYKVADAAERDDLVSQFPPSTSSPLFVWRVDANNGQELEYTKDGTTWYYVPTTEDADRIPNLNASKITSGQFHPDRIPNLSASKITSGTLSADRVPNLNASKINAGTLHADRIPGLPADRIPNLPASKITSGTLSADRIPSLNASKITAGTLSADRIPNLNASKITGGTLSASRIPNLSASKITSGTLSASRLPDISTLKAGSYTLAIQSSNGRIQHKPTYDHTVSGPPNVHVTNEGRFSRATGGAEAETVTSTAYSRQAGSSRYAMWMDGDRRIGRATSSRRYKSDEAPWEIDVEALLAVVPKTFHRNVDPEGVMDFGAIAEDLHDLGLTELVYYDDEGRPDGIQDHRVVWALLGVARRQAEQIDGLHEVVEGLLARVEALEGDADV